MSNISYEDELLAREYYPQTRLRAVFVCFLTRVGSSLLQPGRLNADTHNKPAWLQQHPGLSNACVLEPWPASSFGMAWVLHTQAQRLDASLPWTTAKVRTNGSACRPQTD